jgi:hypothetical protein
VRIFWAKGLELLVEGFWWSLAQPEHYALILFFQTSKTSKASFLLYFMKMEVKKMRAYCLYIISSSNKTMIA